MTDYYKFGVAGYKPILGYEAQKFLGALDVGIDNGYIPFSELIVISYKPDVTPNLDHTMNAIKTAYENIGSVNITVWLADRCLSEMDANQ